ncbi:MAG: EscU/YscU/HrcU family type III secretion system export apparatus switch protein, partial [Rubrivivax sp.]
MADDAQDRNLPASERKIEKARSEGQVARSRELGHLAAMGAGFVLLIVFAPWLTAWGRQLLGEGLSFDAAMLARPGAMTERLAQLATRMLAAV